MYDWIMIAPEGNPFLFLYSIHMNVSNLIYSQESTHKLQFIFFVSEMDSTY